MEVMTGMNMGMWKGCGCFDMSVWTGLNPYRLCAGRREGSWVVTGRCRMAGVFCGAYCLARRCIPWKRGRVCDRYGRGRSRYIGGRLF